MKIRKSLITNISIANACMLSTVIALFIVGACITIGDAREEDFSLKITPKGPSTQTWIGNDGKQYTITWEEPVYKKVSK